VADKGKVSRATPICPQSPSPAPPAGDLYPARSVGYERGLDEKGQGLTGGRIGCCRKNLQRRNIVVKG
jgi:hypothetical protein